MTENDFSGNFFVIEGPDASGKETQTGKIVEWLRKQDYSKITKQQQKKVLEKMPGKYPDPKAEKVKDNIKKGVWRLSFPTYSQTPGGRIVEAYLSGRLGDRKELSMKDKVDIYAADRKQFKHVIQEFLDRGGIIVCDRYREANLIHQLVGFKGEKWREKLEYIKNIDADLPDADKIFYLNISPEEAEKRMMDKDKDIHELDAKYMEKSNRNGQKVAKNQKWTIVDGERQPKTVFEELKNEITEMIG